MYMVIGMNFPLERQASTFLGLTWLDMDWKGSLQCVEKRRPLFSPHHSVPLMVNLKKSFKKKLSDINRDDAAKTAIGVLTTALDLAQTVLQNVPVPGLQLAVQGLLSVITGIEQTRSNLDKLKRIRDNLIELTNSVLEPLSKKSASEISPELEMAVDQLVRKLGTFANEWSNRSSKNVFTRFFQRDADAGDLQEIETTIQQALSIFQVSAAIRQELAGHAFQALYVEQESQKLLRETGKLVDNLPHVPAGFHDARASSSQDGSAAKPTTCFEGTRLSVLNDISLWMHDRAPNAPHLYWLSGVAGIGKSTIAYTIAKVASEEGVLGGSFFISRRSIPSLRDPSIIIPTIARQLAQFSTDLRLLIGQALEKNSNAPLESARRQMDQLILNPLKAANWKGPPIIIVIDALDECDKAGGKDLLQALMGPTAQFSSVIRLFLTSRPELHIRSAFGPQGHKKAFVLHDIEKTVVEGDIHDYLKHGVSEIPAALELDLPPTWVKPKEFKTLVLRAGNLFIYAATVLRVLGDEGEANPPRQLRILLDSRNIAHAGVFAALDELYLQLLHSSYPNKTQTIIDRFHHVVGTIIFLKTPLSMAALERFTGVYPGDVQGALVQLQSVIITPRSRDDYPHIHHPSFPEFLTAPSRCSDKEFLIVEKVQEGWLAARCLYVMIAQLKKDPLGIKEMPSGETWGETERKSKCAALISPELQYACRYWVSHLERADLQDINLAALLQNFTTNFLLRWIEVMGLLGYTDLQLLPSISRQSQTCAISMPCPPNIVSILREAYQLVMLNFDILLRRSSSVYQIITFLPDDSVIRQTYAQTDAETPDSTLSRPAHHAGTFSVALSKDFHRIAAGAADKIVSVWDALLGTHIVDLKGHTDWITFVNFSTQSSSRLLSTSQDNTVIIWNVTTGESRPLIGHTNWVMCGVFSPNGRTVASASEDATIKLWNTESGLNFKTLASDENSPIYSVAFSPDGTKLAAGCHSGTVQLWNAESGDLLWNLLGHPRPAACVAWSPNNLRLVSGSWDFTNRVWEAATGEHVFTIEGHTDGMNCILITPDGSKVISGADDKTVRIWDSASGNLIKVLEERHAHWVMSVSISACGTRLISSSWEGVVVLWDCETWTPLLTLDIAARGKDSF